MLIRLIFIKYVLLGIIDYYNLIDKYNFEFDNYNLFMLYILKPSI